MKFRRQMKLIPIRLDAAPYAGVFFCLIIFVLLGQLIYTPGVRLQLPEADGLPGTDQLTLTVALDGEGQLYFENQRISREELGARLGTAVHRTGGPLTLVVQADKTASYSALLDVTLLARKAGIQQALLSVLPRPGTAPVAARPRP
jgi:biopolymer transport protein ExbD